MFLKASIYAIFFIFSSLYSIGQKKYEIDFISKDIQQIVKNPKTVFKDSSRAVEYIENLQKTAFKKGFLLCSIDSLSQSKNKVSFILDLGRRFRSLKINIPEEEQRFIFKHSKTSEKFISNIPFTPSEFSLIMERIKSAYLDNGYPFVKIKLKNHSFEKDHLNTDLNVNKGPLLRWKKIHIQGDSSLSIKYLSNLIDIKVGELYNESVTEKISGKIRQVPFIKESKPAQFLYSKEGVEVYLYLESVQISAINGIIGFQPNPVTDKISITGELNLKLNNILRRGELLDLRWQSIRDQTQSLVTKLNYPFIFNSSFGIDGGFNLYKRDTSFLELNSSIGVQYNLLKGNVLKVFYQNISSNILSGGTNNPTFTNLNSVKSNNYGISFLSKRIDYIPNPSKGFIIEVTGAVGSRTSTSLDSLIIKKDITYRGKLNAELYIPISRRHIMKLANLTQFYNAPNIYQNELFRFGGLTNQRGFDEDELVSTTKSSSTIEYRFLLDKNSHVFAFYDQTWYENNSKEYSNDTPLGFGIGFSFSTNFGVFSISTALGKQLNNQILLRDSKVHFGYIVYF